MSVQIELTGVDVARFTDSDSVYHDLREGMVASVPDAWWDAQDASFKRMFVFHGDDADFRVAGFFHLTASAETNIPAVNTPVKVAGTSAPGAENVRFSNGDNRLTYTGSATVLVKLDAVVAVAAANNTNLTFYIAKNGSIIEESESAVRTGTGGDERQGSVMALTSADTGDFFEVWVENNTDDSNLTCVTLKMAATT